MEKTKIIEQTQKRKNFKLWLVLTFVALYPLYYFLSNLPESYSFESLFLDDFENQGLLVLLFLFPLTMFIINFTQKDKRIFKEFNYRLEMEDKIFYLNTHIKTFSINKGASKQKLISEKDNKSPLSLKADQIVNIEERRRSGTSTRQQMSIPVDGSGTIGDKLNQPLELTKTTSNYDYMETFFEYQDGSTQSFHAPYTIEELKNFLKI